VLVEDIDPQGKISLKPVGSEWEAPAGTEPQGDGGGERQQRSPRPDRPPRQGKRFRDREGGGERSDT